MSAELADTATMVILTASGLIGRYHSDASSDAPVKRKKHDALSVKITTTTRSDIGALTSSGRVVRVHVGDVPPTGELWDVGAAVQASSFFGLSKSEKLITVFEISESNELVLGTAQGVVKRVLADYPVKDEFEVIALKDGDSVVGASLAGDSSQLVFVTSDAQVLRFDGSVVRAQGRPAGGVAGINLSGGAKAIAFGKASNDGNTFIVTAANSSQALVGTDAGSIKVSALDEFPPKGRATGGVRGHKFLRNEDQLYFAAISNGVPAALASDGKPFELPELAKRDASGSSAHAIIGGVGTL